MKNKKAISFIIILLVVSQVSIAFRIHAETAHPVISNIIFTPTNPTPNDVVTVCANITYSEGLKEAKLNYKALSENEWHSKNMKNYFDFTFYEQIETYSLGETITFFIKAISLDGFTQTSSNFSYTVKEYLIPSFGKIGRNPILPQYDEDVEIKVKVLDLLEITHTYLYYQINDSSPTFIPLDYNETIDLYSCFIPRTNSYDTKVEYWIEATNSDNHVGISKKEIYVTVGNVPYLHDLWTEPYNVTENVDLTFFCNLFYRCEIVSSEVHYRINLGNISTLTLVQTDDIKWSSEPLLGMLLEGGNVFEYWIVINYQIENNFYIYPQQPVHHFKLVVEYNDPYIDDVLISPSIIYKGNEVTITASITDQSIIIVDCIWSIPGEVNETENIMTNIQGTDDWFTSIPTISLPEKKNVIITIQAKDINGEETVFYSGFFINDGSTPVLYNIKDLHEEKICHSHEHTLYVYVNDSSEIDWVKLHIWTNNDSTPYGVYAMIKGGEHVYYYTLDEGFPISTWITYQFEAQDIHGYNTLSEQLIFLIWDYTGPSFTDFYSMETIGYLDSPIFKTKISDGTGSGVKAANMVYSDDNWNTNTTISLFYDGDSWWSSGNIPLLELGVLRQYYFASVDWNNNPSQTFIYSYSSVDLYPPTFTNWELNDGEQINDTVDLIRVELWLDDPSSIEETTVNFTFYSLKEDTIYTFHLTNVSNIYYETYISYSWIAHDYISYYFESEDTLGFSGASEIYYFTVVDTLDPEISTSVSYSGGAWTDSQSLDEDPNNVYSDAWLIDFSSDLIILSTIVDDTLTEVRLYYSSDGATFNDYLIIQYIGGNNYQVTIDYNLLTSIYSNAQFPGISHELLFLKLWAIDNASHISEFFFWDDNNTCFELYDYSSPLLTNFIIPSTVNSGNCPTIQLIAQDYKGITDSLIRFRYGIYTTDWFSMNLIAGNLFNGNYEYNNWQVPLDYDGIVFIDFQFSDACGVVYLFFWKHTDTDIQTITNSDNCFTAFDSVAPAILDHYRVPSIPEYFEQFRFYAEIIDSCSGLDDVWVEWWKNDILQTNIYLSLFLEDVFRSDLIGVFDYDTKIEYIIHATDNRGNEVYTSPLVFYIIDTQLPVISNIQFSPDPISDSVDYVSISCSAIDDGSDIDNCAVKWYKNGNYISSQYMTRNGNSFSYDVYVGSWSAGDELTFKITAYDNAGNNRISSLYGPYEIVDVTPPTISGVSRSPTTVYKNNLVTVTATVIDTGSGLDWVKLYHKHGGGYWSSTSMSYIGNNLYRGTYYASGIVGITDYYYVKACDNSANTAQSSTYSYLVKYSGGGGGPIQPTLNTTLSTIDYLDNYDEGILRIDKSSLNNIPQEYVSSIIVFYHAIGEQSWHRVYAKTTPDEYISYVSSRYFLVLEYFIEVNLIFEETINSNTKYLELIDLTPPNFEISFDTVNPNYNSEIFFDIFAFDSSGISQVICKINYGQGWISEPVYRLNDNDFLFVHRLKESVQIMFKIYDSNGHSSESQIFEYIVFSSDNQENNINHTSSPFSFFLVLGTLLFIFGVLTPTVKNFWRNKNEN